MDPDLFITIAFVALAVVFAIAGLLIARHERRMETPSRLEDHAVPTSQSAIES
jgi:hypothetical protein